MFPHILILTVPPAFTLWQVMPRYLVLSYPKNITFLLSIYIFRFFFSLIALSWSLDGLFSPSQTVVELRLWFSVFFLFTFNTHQSLFNVDGQILLKYIILEFLLLIGKSRQFIFIDWTHRTGSNFIFSYIFLFIFPFKYFHCMICVLVCVTYILVLCSFVLFTEISFLLW